VGADVAAARVRKRPIYCRHTYISSMLDLTGTPLFVTRQTGTT
jgi:hypothetical protein